MQVAQGDLSAALTSYRASLAIAERLTKADPATRAGSATWRCRNRIGDVHRRRAICRRRSRATGPRSQSGAPGQADPGNAEWQRDLSVSHDRIGDVQRTQGDLPAALTSYRASLAIRERLAKADPGNAGWQRDLIVSYVRLSEATGDRAYAARALSVALEMQQRGILAPRDAWMIEDLKKRASQ